MVVFFLSKRISLQPRCCTCSNVIAIGIHHYKFIEYCRLVQIVWEGTDVAGSLKLTDILHSLGILNFKIPSEQKYNINAIITKSR